MRDLAGGGPLASGILLTARRQKEGMDSVRHVAACPWHSMNKARSIFEARKAKVLSMPAYRPRRIYAGGELGLRLCLAKFFGRSDPAQPDPEW